MGGDEKPLLKVVFDAATAHGLAAAGAFVAAQLGEPSTAALGALAGEAATRVYRKVRSMRRDALLRTEDIDYTNEFVLSYYADPEPPIRWLESSRGFRTPYHVLIDFRSSDDESWGHYSIEGDFRLDPCLHAHRDRKIKQLEKQKRLTRNDVLPRLRTIDVQNRLLTLQRALYTDQVGSNLTIDATLPVPLEGAATLRAWDAKGSRPSVPPFEISRLANTIGVAVAVTARVDGRKVLIVRTRTDQTAVYAGMEGPAVTFALELERGIAPAGPMRRMILDDLNLEVLQELSLDRLDRFHEPRPLALCRDLVRGGKPQYFIELEIREEWQHARELVENWHALARSGQTALEFQNAGRPVDEVGDAVLSPESDACRVLLNMV